MGRHGPLRPLRRAGFQPAMPASLRAFFSSPLGLPPHDRLSIRQSSPSSVPNGKWGPITPIAAATPYPVLPELGNWSLSPFSHRFHRRSSGRPHDAGQKPGGRMKSRPHFCVVHPVGLRGSGERRLAPAGGADEHHDRGFGAITGNPTYRSQPWADVLLAAMNGPEISNFNSPTVFRRGRSRAFRPVLCSVPV
jgi:hypothetical protein